MNDIILENVDGKMEINCDSKKYLECPTNYRFYLSEKDKKTIVDNSMIKKLQNYNFMFYLILILVMLKIPKYYFQPRILRMPIIMKTILILICI